MNNAPIDTILQGDALTMLRTLPDESAQMCVTSPPYYGLRDYGTATWEGGSSDCNHAQERRTSKSTLGMAKGQGSHDALPRRENAVVVPFTDRCGKCGATRIDQQIGLESSVEEYVARLVEVFAEVRRVLRADGTLWLNLGDSYANDTKWGGSSGGINDTSRRGGYHGQRDKRYTGLKPKDLIGIPWRVAFALQAAGWWLRSDIIWSKPNPMPESVTDRPTRSHEYIFLLAKSERYYYDADAVREPHSDPKVVDGKFTGSGGVNTDGYQGRTKDGMARTSFAMRDREYNPAGRNKRTVWRVATQPYAGAHFATMPPKLIEPCILAGCPAGGIVLDPFFGSGTTGEVAIRHNRHYLGIELNAAYIQLAEERLGKGIQRVLWSTVADGESEVAS